MRSRAYWDRWVLRLLKGAAYHDHADARRRLHQGRHLPSQLDRSDCPHVSPGTHSTGITDWRGAALKDVASIVRHHAA
jgi:hypothetical protein